MSPLGYQTDFTGEVNIVPPLNEHEAAYLRDFNGTRRMDREEGPYFAKDDGNFGQGDTPGVRNHNGPPDGQPGLWCKWIPGDSYLYKKPTENGCLEWDGNEKFYNATEWMIYLIDHFLMSGAVASQDIAESVKQDPRFEHFTFDHVLNGEIYAQGEDPDDRWKLVVVDNVVKTAHAVITYPDPE